LIVSRRSLSTTLKMRSSNATLITAALLVTAGACTRKDSTRATDSAAAQTVTKQSSELASAAPASADSGTTVTATGYGPLRIGMTAANAATAIGAPIPNMAGLDTACAYLPVKTAPAGMRIMITGGTVARIEVDSSEVTTGLGARVGDTEARVHELYGSRVSVQPHKYLPNGHYLIVAPVPPTDSSFRLIFETDGSHITRYRAGRLPQVEWVEGCA
jgi:hypothetical protein